jgi:hypothetical protein
VLFHVTATTSAIVTVVNWAVLYPMLTSDPDPQHAAAARALLCNFIGYAQHGGVGGWVDWWMGGLGSREAAGDAS